MSFARVDAGEKESTWLVKTLGKMDFFSQLTVGQLETILPYIGLYVIPKRTEIFKEGQQGDAMFILYSGKVSIRRKGGMFGMNKEIAQLNPGSIFGEMSLIDETPRNATAVAAQNSEVFILLLSDFQYLVQQNPSVAQHIKRLSSQRKMGLS